MAIATANSTTPLAFAFLVICLRGLAVDAGRRVIVRVTASFARAPVALTLNGTPPLAMGSAIGRLTTTAAWEGAVEGGYAMAALGARMRATAAAATRTARRVMAKNPHEVITAGIAQEQQSEAYCDHEPRAEASLKNLWTAVLTGVAGAME